jgi:cold shock CspA family protein
MRDAPLPAGIEMTLEPVGQRIDGEIVSYFADRGFGFVAHGASHDTTFFHVSQCQGLDGVQPEPGQSVSFLLGRNHGSGKSQAEELLLRVRAKAAHSAG